MKSVLVTGSSRGIGKSIALDLAQSGYTTVVHGKNHSSHLDTTFKQIEELGVPVRKLVFDISNRQQCRQVLENDISGSGMYYGIVLNAGVSKDNAFPFMGDKDWDDVLSTNLNSFYNILKPLVEPMIVARQGGRIVVMSSVAGILGNRGQVNYSAAKSGLIGAARALGLELAKRKITVNCVAPGLIETDMTAELDKSHVLPMIPMRRIGNADEVCGIVSFLMSDKAGYITRQTIAVDGGLT